MSRRLLLPLQQTHLLRQPLLRGRITAVRHASTGNNNNNNKTSFFQDQPAPPRLPPEEQAEFERLQRAAEAALSSHNTVVSPPSAADAASSQPSQSQSQSQTQAQTQTQTQTQARIQPDVAGAGTLSGGIRQGAPPEFEGDRNPRTGEVGGPKNEPLRWGSQGDWSYNGRVTDF